MFRKTLVIVFAICSLIPFFSSDSGGKRSEPLPGISVLPQGASGNATCFLRRSEVAKVDADVDHAEEAV